MSSSSSTCTVCLETLNKQKRAKIECKYCHYIACRECVQRYVMQSTIDPRCMNCQTPWDPEYFRTLFSRVFLNTTYKEHRQNMLLSLEESMLPDTQEHVAYMRETATMRRELVALNRRIQELREDYIRRCAVYHTRVARQNAGRTTGATEERKKFTMKCPDMTCRGFLSTQYTCGQCSQRFCKDCHALKADDHECRDEDRETVTLLMTNTKNCPECAMPIYKISGCSQMFCVECHTPFDWNTGRVIRGTAFHNPHYFEWQARHAENGAEDPRGGAANDMACRRERMPHVRIFYNFFANTTCSEMRTFIQAIAHIENVIVIPTENVCMATDRTRRNRDVRVQYINGEITRDELKKIVERRDKADQRSRLRVQIWRMYVACATDLVNNLLVHRNLNTFTTEKAQLIAYCNTELGRVSRLFSSTSRQRIHPNGHAYYTD